MYNIFWKSDEPNEVVGDLKSIIDVANLLENSKIKFKISDRNGPIDQEWIGTTGFKFWLSKNESF
jgi:hypothetical protein